MFLLRLVLSLRTQVKMAVSLTVTMNCHLTLRQVSHASTLPASSNLPLTLLLCFHSLNCFTSVKLFIKPLQQPRLYDSSYIIMRKRATFQKFEVSKNKIVCLFSKYTLLFCKNAMKILFKWAFLFILIMVAIKFIK